MSSPSLPRRSGSSVLAAIRQKLAVHGLTDSPSESLQVPDPTVAPRPTVQTSWSLRKREFIATPEHSPSTARSESSGNCLKTSSRGVVRFDPSECDLTDDASNKSSVFTPTLEEKSAESPPVQQTTLAMSGNDIEFALDESEESVKLTAVTQDENGALAAEDEGAPNKESASETNGARQDESTAATTVISEENDAQGGERADKRPPCELTATLIHVNHEPPHALTATLLYVDLEEVAEDAPPIEQVHVVTRSSRVDSSPPTPSLPPLQRGKTEEEDNAMKERKPDAEPLRLPLEHVQVEPDDVKDGKSARKKTFRLKSGRKADKTTVHEKYASDNAVRVLDSRPSVDDALVHERKSLDDNDTSLPERRTPRFRGRSLKKKGREQQRTMGFRKSSDDSDEDGSSLFLPDGETRKTSKKLSAKDRKNSNDNSSTKKGRRKLLVESAGNSPSPSDKHDSPKKTVKRHRSNEDALRDESEPTPAGAITTRETVVKRRTGSTSDDGNEATMSGSDLVGGIGDYKQMSTSSPSLLRRISGMDASISTAEATRTLRDKDEEQRMTVQDDAPLSKKKVAASEGVVSPRKKAPLSFLSPLKKFGQSRNKRSDSRKSKDREREETKEVKEIHIRVNEANTSAASPTLSTHEGTRISEGTAPSPSPSTRRKGLHPMLSAQRPSDLLREQLRLKRIAEENGTQGGPAKGDEYASIPSTSSGVRLEPSRASPRSEDELVSSPRRQMSIRALTVDSPRSRACSYAPPPVSTLFVSSPKNRISPENKRVSCAHSRSQSTTSASSHVLRLLRELSEDDQHDEPLSPLSASSPLVTNSPASNRRQLIKHRSRNVSKEKDDAVSLPLPPVISTDQSTFMVPPTSDTLDQPQLIHFEDVYAARFFNKVHLNFIGVHTRTSEVIVTSILRILVGNTFVAMRTSKRNVEEFSIRVSELEMSKKSELADRLEDLLNQKFGDYQFHYVQDAAFALDLREIEHKHPQEVSSMKVALLYSNGTERTFQSLMGKTEDDVSNTYFEFLDLFGRLVQLKGWKKYRGDLGTDYEQESYYCEWNEVEIMGHVAMWMNAEQQRRLVGNDVLFIIYLEEDAPPFDPEPLDSLGSVPQIFCVVQPYAGHYRLGFFCRPNIKPFEPVVPQCYLFAPTDLKDFLFTKLYNGYVQALRCPPMNRLFEVPRKAALEELAESYPKLSNKDQKERFNSERSRRQKMREMATRLPNPTKVVVRVLSREGNGDVYVAVTVGDERTKTSAVKNSGNCEWNEELSLCATPYAIHFEMKCSSARLGPAVSLGSVWLSFADVSKNLNLDRWYLVVNEEDPTSALGMGELSLTLSFSGPNATPCPACNLPIGESSMMLVHRQRFHEHCAQCIKCRRRLSESEFVLQENVFYCHRDFERVFGGDALTPTVLENSRGLLVPSPLQHLTHSKK